MFLLLEDYRLDCHCCRSACKLCLPALRTWEDPALPTFHLLLPASLIPASGGLAYWRLHLPTHRLLSRYPRLGLGTTCNNTTLLTAFSCYTCLPSTSPVLPFSLYTANRTTTCLPTTPASIALEVSAIHTLAHWDPGITHLLLPLWAGACLPLGQEDLLPPADLPLPGGGLLLYLILPWTPTAPAGVLAPYLAFLYCCLPPPGRATYTTFSPATRTPVSPGSSGLDSTTSTSLPLGLCLPTSAPPPAPGVLPQATTWRTSASLPLQRLS